MDGYTVVATDNSDSLAEAFEEHPGGSRGLLGSDSGALTAWRTALADGFRLDGLVLAGLPLEPARTVLPDREAELAARTACPVHSALISDDPLFGWGELASASGQVPVSLPDLPVLLLHGEADLIAPVEPVRRLASARPSAKLGVVSDGLHDVLNDQFHRSVAARLVLFLEEIGKGALLRDEVIEPVKPVRARRAAPVHVSARVDYALRAIAELAGSGQVPVRCESIASARGLPLNSLVNLMIELRRAGLAHSQRGCEGGYWLARPASEITVAEVVRAVEGELVSRHADGPDSWLWDRLGQTVAEFLGGWTISDVAAGPGRRTTP